MNAPLRFETYEAAGRREWMMRIGGEGTADVLVLTPFFHEGNRVRTLASALMRALARRGLSSALPDLPGCGESAEPLPTGIEAWRDAAAAAHEASGARVTLAIRTGALLDTVVPAARRWRLSPATGASLLRDLVRSRAVDARESGGHETVAEIVSRARIEGSLLAGYRVRATLFRSLETAEPAAEASRTVRLCGDARPADARIPGPLLWRQPEPSFETGFIAALAEDFASWTETCGAF